MENYNRLKLVGKGSFGFAVLVEDVHNHKYYLLKVGTVSGGSRYLHDEPTAKKSSC